MVKKLKAEELKLKVLYMALIFGQLLIAGAAFLVIKPEYQPSTVWRLALPVIMLGIMVGAYQMYLQPIRKLPHLVKIHSENLLDNNAVPLPANEVLAHFAQYRTYVIVRLAMLEGANLMAIALYIVTGDFLLLFYAFLGLLVFGTAFPSVRQFARDYHLTLVEERALKRD